MLENELKNLLAKTAVDTKPLDINIGKSVNLSTVDEPIKIKFNRNYFTTLKLLEDTLAKQFKEERGALFVNEALVKFSYLGQIFLNCFCIHATLYPENNDYNSFELTIFYLALINLAYQYKFTNLAATLKKNHSYIFNSEDNNLISLIITNSDIYKRRFYQEIKLFEQQFRFHYNATIKSKMTYTTHLDINTRTVNYQQLLHRLMNTRLHSYQQQLLLRFMQFTNIDPILISRETKKIIEKIIKNVKANDTEDKKKEIINTACLEYQDILKHNCMFTMTDNNITNEAIISLPTNYDGGKLSLHFIEMSRINLGKEKLSVVIGCRFEDCTFNDDNFKETQFSHCYFINCDFRGRTLSGVLSDCRFEQCNFIGAYFERLILTNCIFKKCNLNDMQWYKVSLFSGEILHSTLINAVIKFSKVIITEFFNVNFTETIFEGTIFKPISSLENNWTRVNLDDALFLADINAFDNSFTEHLFANIEDRLIALFGAGTDFSKLLISSSDITTKLNQIIHDEEPIHMKNYGSSFKNQLGWISCAIDRLTEYCEHYKKYKMNFNFRNSITHFEILADTVKTAIHLFRYRYLTLHDRCHINLMSSVLKNGLFYNYQQYQEALCKTKPTLSHNNFADHEKVLHDDDPDNRDQAKFKKRESLIEIIRLPAKLKNIEETLSEMLHEVERQQRLDHSHQRKPAVRAG